MIERFVEQNRSWLPSAAGVLAGLTYLALLTGMSRWVVLVLGGLLLIAVLLLARADRWLGWLWRRPALLGLLGIATLGLAVRVLGVGFGLPYVDQVDEPSVADKSLRMLQTGDLNPDYFTYPHLYYYMQAGLYAVRYLALVSSGVATDITTVNPTDFYLWGRLLTVALGVGTIFAVFAAGRRLYGLLAGLVAAAFIAFSSIHMRESQFITTDVPASFFTALAFALICGLLPLAEDARTSPAATIAPADGGFAHRSAADVADNGLTGSDGFAHRSAAVVPGSAVAESGGTISEATHPPPTPPSRGGENADPPPTSPSRGGGSLRSAGYYALVGVGMGLAVGSKYNSALIVLPFLVAHAYAGWDSWRRLLAGRLWVAMLAMLGTFVATTPFLLFNIPQFLNEVGDVIIHYKFTGHDGFESDQNWLYYLESLLKADTGVTILALIGTAIALLRHRPADVLTLSFPLVYYLTMSGYKVNFLRNLLPMLPFVAILAALPLLLLYRYLLARHQQRDATYISQVIKNKRVVMAGLVVVVALAVAAPAWAAMQNGWKNSQPDNRLLARQWLDANAGRGAKLWLEPFTLLLPSDRYLVQGGDSVLSHSLDWYVQNRFDYLIVTDKQSRVNFGNQHADLLAADFPDRRSNPGPYLSIYRSGYQPSSVQPQRPLTVTLTEGGGGSITLLGVDLQDRVAPGGKLPLTLYWRADAPLRADYTVFVHLLDRNGNKVAQRDTPPRSGSLPTSAWQQGQLVVDEQDLDLPADLPADSYRLVIGLYQPQSGARLQGGQDGAVELGTVTIAK